MSAQSQQLPFRFRMITSSLNALAQILPRAAGRFAFDLFSTPRSAPAHQRRAPHALASANPLEVRFGSKILRAWEWGAGERTIMLVHGWESEATGLAAFILPLVERGYRVIALDGPAHGDSPGKQLNIVDYVAALRSTIAQHGSVYAVIAHSFGGAAALFAMGEPEGLGKVERVVTIGAPARLQSILERFTQSIGLTSGVLAAMLEAGRRRFGRSIADFDPARVQKTLTPLMVVHDRADVIVPFGDAEDITRVIPHAQPLFTEGLGHRSILKNREVISQVIGFIES